MGGSNARGFFLFQFRWRKEVMVRININLKRGPEQQRFLDYFNSRLSPRLSSARGTAGFREDGTFESVVTGPFNLDQDQIVELSWMYIKSQDGELLFIEVEQVVSDNSDAWQSAVNEVVVGALTSALVGAAAGLVSAGFFVYDRPGEYSAPGISESRRVSWPSQYHRAECFKRIHNFGRDRCIAEYPWPCRG
jgi:hypothetical protein